MDSSSLSQQPYITFFDSDTAEYDVIVDQSSSAPNLKEATWAAIQPLLQIIGQQMGPEEMALVLEYSPMPESFLEKLKAIQEQKAQQPPPPDPEMMKIEAMKQAKDAELQMRQQEVGLEMQLEQQKVASEITLERQKAAAQIQLEREKLQAQLKLKRIEMRQKAKADAQAQANDGDGSETSAASAVEIDIEDGDSMEEQDMDLFGNKALSDSMTEMARAVAAMAEGVATLGVKIEQAMSRPKQIIRGPDGRAVGVR
jgi:hypothetical protein